MTEWRAVAVAAMLTATSACSSAVQSSGDTNDEAATEAAATTPESEVASTPAPATTRAATTTATTTTATSTTTTSPPTTSSTTSTTTSSTTTTSTTTTSTTTTTTTTTLPPPEVYDAACVVQVQAGDDLATIVTEFDDDSVDVETVLAENGLDFDVLVAGQLLDMCVDNGLNDIDGSARTERNSVVVRREVEAQQITLNQLFEGYGIRELLVDGVSGPVTRQRLCAFRLAADLPVNRQDMVAGSEEEQILMSMETLPIPFTSAILSERWVLIDQTCQIMFVGLGTQGLQFVFPTSTGLSEFPTRLQNRSRVFRYNSASHNGGWHDSTTYPAAADNPLNGNMYKPLYFDGGQAIHGANNVPRSPASHGCARLRVGHMDALVDWLGLGDVRGATGNSGRINLTVNVQGRYGG